MQTHRHTISRLFQQADHFLGLRDWDQAASRCYEILGLDPTNADAENKLILIYRQPELADEMRSALGRLFHRPDASPCQARRRVAFSYRVLTCWPGWRRDDFDQAPPAPELEKVEHIISHAYVCGVDADLLEAWNLYVEACRRWPGLRRACQWWMAKQYAGHGFFADAAEVLMEICGGLPADPDAAYLLAEVRWWRDHGQEIAWLR